MDLHVAYGFQVGKSTFWDQRNLITMKRSKKKSYKIVYINFIVTTYNILRDFSPCKESLCTHCNLL